METVIESKVPPLTPTGLRPTDATTFFHCSVCAQPVARWSILRTNKHICALCFFNTTDWVREHWERFDAVIRAISFRRNQVIPRTEKGGLVEVKDADNVLGAIVLHDLFDKVTSLRRS